MLYFKALHIIFVVTWFAGLFYIVRLFIYQTEANEKAEPDRTILVNEYRRISRLLWLMITWPSAVLTLILGLTMLQQFPVWPTWLFIKLSLVALLYIYQFLCHRLYLQLRRKQYPASSIQLRIWNEVATILLVSIVFLVVLKSTLDMAYGLLGLVSNRNMPLDGDTKFKNLKKSYAHGTELRGKTLGIIGFGRIGREVAKIALGIGMKVIAADKYVDNAVIKVEFYNGQYINVNIQTESTKEVYRQSDFITLHVPAQKDYVIGKKQFDLMKNGVGIINAARGGVIDEVALIEAIENGKVGFAGLDTFEEEPTPAIKVLMNDKISLTPHIGAATNEAQDRIGTELASQIISILKTENVKS